MITDPTSKKRTAEYWLAAEEIVRIKNEAADRLPKADKPLTEKEDK